MAAYKVKIELLSDTIVGSAEGFGGTIDTDVIFDDVGLPYIPARRVKGILRDSAENLCEIFKLADIDFPINVKELFGNKGRTSGSTMFYLSNFYIPEYEENREYLNYCFANKKFGLSLNGVINYFCTLRQQTSIDEEKGTAQEHSLRTSRVINRGHVFEGELECDENYRNVLGIICRNARRMGTKRNRGFGNIKITLHDTGTGTDITEECLRVLEEKV